jgi:hypothetical protein
MLKVCPSCQGLYELKYVTCLTCKKELVPRKGSEAAARPNYDPVSYRDGFLLILVVFLYLIGERSIVMAFIAYSVFSRYKEYGIRRRKP